MKKFGRGTLSKIETVPVVGGANLSLVQLAAAVVLEALATLKLVGLLEFIVLPLSYISERYLCLTHWEETKLFP